MPAKLALLACLGLVAAFYVKELKADRASFAPWLVTAWILYCGSRPLETWFASGPVLESAALQASIAGSPLDQAVLTALMVLGLLVLYRRDLPWGDVLRDNGWLAALFLYMALSIVWSDYPWTSAKRWLRTTGDLVMVLVLLTTARPLEAFAASMRRGAFLLLPLSIVLVKYFPALGIDYTEDGARKMWLGVTGQKNQLGYVSMVFALFFAHALLLYWWQRRRDRRFLLLHAGGLVLALYLLRGAASSTSQAAFGFGLALLAGFAYGGRSLARSAATMVTALVLGAGIVLLVSEQQGSVYATFGRDSTLTGRTDIWDVVQAIGPGDPVLGRGYGSFWTPAHLAEVWARIGTPIKQSHNGYLDVYLELGLVGVVLLTGAMASALRGAARALAASFTWGSFRCVLLCVILLHNVTESSFLRPTHFMWLMLLLVTANLRRRSLGFTAVAASVPHDGRAIVPASAGSPRELVRTRRMKPAPARTPARGS